MANKVSQLHHCCASRVQNALTRHSPPPAHQGSLNDNDDAAAVFDLQKNSIPPLTVALESRHRKGDKVKAVQ